MQLKSLEEFVGAPLFTRRGRGLQLTETGELVHRYAEDIFQTGRELVDAIRGRPAGRPRTFRVGIVDVMAKLVAFQLLQPVLDLDEPVSLYCREEEPNRLFAELAVHELDLVLSDIPVAPGLNIKAYNHVVGGSTTTIFAAPELARRLKRRFPQSLSGAPFLMPSPNTAIRRSLELWLQEENVHPLRIGEFQDSALMMVFGQGGRGVLPGPTVMASQISKQYGLQALGEIGQVEERFYVISPERKIKHPAVAHIVEQARSGLFRKVSGARG
jgi:LysR family transcriptional activator of nhaA